MTDPLFERAERAIEESTSLRRDRHALAERFSGMAAKVRSAVAASEVARVQARAEWNRRNPCGVKAATEEESDGDLPSPQNP